MLFYTVTDEQFVGRLVYGEQFRSLWSRWAQDGPVGWWLVARWRRPWQTQAVRHTRGREKEVHAEGQRIGKQGGRVPRASAVPLIIGGDERVTPRSDRKLVTPVGSINQPQSYSAVLSGTPRRAPRWKLLPPSCPRYRSRR
ncbi:uncharacterized protein LOC120359156 [Solenopsis invicta]|uniref:uncharacterized protein LOC120359156 n=1 Tax=Solenopsis invicta TaxID=13686 RepID=UPI00193D9CCF|nr:uncharacterized protein LOC120359156 [Solenopsis invicta]